MQKRGGQGFESFSNYVKRDQVILDVGCGYGRTLDELYHNGYRNLIGIDFSEQEYSHVTKTTMNGHQSNGFYLIGQLK